MRTMIIGVIVATSFAGPALADWWIVRSSDKKCLFVDVRADRQECHQDRHTLL